MDQESFNDKFRRRTKALALAIIKLLSPIKYSDAVGVLRKQIIRSGTSIASNFRAYSRGRSEKERYAKICIVVEEADETLFWLEMLVEANLIPKKETIEIEAAALEILKVMSGHKKRLSQNLQ